MPSDYLTWPITGYRADRNLSDQGVDDFIFYDQYVRQPRPWVIQAAVRFEDGTTRQETKVLCIAPDDVVGESRRPEGKWPAQTGGVGLRMWTGDEILMVLALAASVLLVL